MEMYLIDTNVMLAASAVHELSNLAVIAMPQEIELREILFEWLVAFDESDSNIVLDEEDLIRKEYERNMRFNYPEQEYGMQVLQSKFDQGLVELVPIETLEANGEHIAILSDEHQLIVADREDRKWVASALSCLSLNNCSPPIVYGAETDWFKAAERLFGIGVKLVQLLPDEWYLDRLKL